jgi:hypothetical protein
VFAKRTRKDAYIVILLLLSFLNGKRKGFFKKKTKERKS